MWIDAHCHLQMGEDAWAAIERAKKASVDKLVCIGTDSETSAQAVDIARSAGGTVFAAIGLHPHEAKEGLGKTIEILHEAIANSDSRVVGIGECGLDYYYEHSPRDVQREVFARQVELAKELELALIIHTRDAWDETFDILRSEGVPPRTVIHCFTGGVPEAEIALELGLYLSFSGIVTFPKASEVQEAARICPLERLLIETDSPFLTPVPYRGKTNEPAYLPLIGEFISGLKNIQLEAFADQVSKTTEALFHLW